MNRLMLFIALMLSATPAWAEIDAATETAAHVPPAIQARLRPDAVPSLDKALADAGENAAQLVAALDLLDGSQFDDAVFLIDNMPHLDRLEMTRDVLVHHIVYADLARRIFPWQIPDSLYRQYILTYRLDQEPITDWRAAFWPKVKARSKGITTTEEFARRLNEWVISAVREQEGEFFGGQQAPDQTLAAGRGTRKEISSLMAALLKTAGIPSRRVSVPALLGQSGGAQWTEVYIAEKGKWLPLYPHAPQRFGDFALWEPDSLKSNVSVANAQSAFEFLDVTPNYTETGDLEVHFTRGGAPAANFDGFSINVYNQGAFTALDELGTACDANGDFRCTLGEGRYWIISGTRDLTGSPYVWVQPMDVHPGLPAKIVIDLTPGLYVSFDPDTLRTAVEVPLFALADATGQLRSSREAVGKGPLLIVVLRPDHEPSTRTTDLVRSWLNKRGEKAPTTLWVMESEKGSADPADWTYDPEHKIGNLFGLNSPDNYPLVLWVNRGGHIALTSKGYNLNVAAMLEGSGR